MANRVPIRAPRRPPRHLAKLDPLLIPVQRRDGSEDGAIRVRAFHDDVAAWASSVERDEVKLRVPERCRRGSQVDAADPALERLREGAPGACGYALFAVSRADLRRLRELHLEYVRATQYVISASKPGECVALFCAQLLDLAAKDNAFGERNETVA